MPFVTLKEGIEKGKENYIFFYENKRIYHVDLKLHLEKNWLKTTYIFSLQLLEPFEFYDGLGHFDETLN